MIKVLHFVSTPSIGSGVMSVIMNYYRHMDRSKIQFDFLCFIPCEDSYEKEINELGGRVFFVSKPGSSLKSIKELQDFFVCHKGEYQWLHNHEVYLSFLLKPLANKFQIPKFIIHCHATQYSERKAGAIRNAILCFPIRFMEYERLACSKAAGIFLYGNKKVENGEVRVFYNAVEREKYQFSPEKRMALRKELGVTEENIVLGHVGRFAEQKNHKFLIEIFYEIINKKSEARLLCIGEGPLSNEIKKQVVELGLIEKVIFLGQRNDVHEWLSSMDVFILPSLFEGFPVSLVEALCNGLNCLVADTISNELVSDQIYRLSLKQLPTMWAEKVLELATMERSEKQYIPAYDIKQQANTLQEFYLNSRKWKCC